MSVEEEEEEGGRRRRGGRRGEEEERGGRHHNYCVETIVLIQTISLNITILSSSLLSPPNSS